MTSQGNVNIKKTSFRYLWLFVTLISFLIYFFVTLHNLTHASLWYDETIEYWFSKIMFGPTPFDNMGSMYERIVITYQPPLYNFLMFFWLKISSSEWWFRFFGVVAGFTFNLALFKTIYRVGDAFFANCAVIFSVFSFQLVYYWQECSEYCLVLAMLAWAIYYFFRCLKEQKRRDYILFTLFCSLAIYSQYGAVFLVLPMAFYLLFSAKDRRLMLVITQVYSAFLLLAGIPLIAFFLVKQMKHQQNNGLTSIPELIGGGYTTDFVGRFRDVFRWNFFSFLGMYKTELILVTVCLLTLFILVVVKGKDIAIVTALMLGSFIFYYFTVRKGLYSYGQYGNRYNLFLIPIEIVFLFCLTSTIFNWIKPYMKTSFQMICIACLIFYSITSWNSSIKNNWSKEDIRGAVSYWFQEKGTETNTLVYPFGSSGFSYYIRENEKHDEDVENKVVYMAPFWNKSYGEAVYINPYRDKSYEEILDLLNEIYMDDWPQKLMFIGSHTRGKKDYQLIVDAFVNKGYDVEILFWENDAFLYRLTKRS